MAKSFHRFCLLLLVLAALAAPSFAERSPASQAIGSADAAAHLLTHVGAFSPPALAQGLHTNPENISVFCTGSRVSLWDSPLKGERQGRIYPGTKLGTLEKNSAFELVKVVAYRDAVFAMVRLYANGFSTLSGWVNADYISCSCTQWDERADIPAYAEQSLTFDLR